MEIHLVVFETPNHKSEPYAEAKGEKGKVIKVWDSPSK